MKIYLAPLQGLTDWVFRESYSQHIGRFDKTFTPFVRMQGGDFYRPAQCNDLLPEHNHFQCPVPQFLGNDADSFRSFEELCLKHGYHDVNINMGCPFSMVTGKGLGAGMLACPENVERFFNEVFANTKLRISIKCRLGQENTSEFESLIPVFNNYPLDEIIVHPRVGKQQYKGNVDLDAFARYAPLLRHSVCYNGDILDVSDVQRIKAFVPTVDKIMIGRGIFENPFLLNEIRQENLSDDEKKTRLKNFHLSLIENSKLKYSGDTPMLHRFVEMWTYHAQAFDDGHKIFKQIKKCTTLAKYEAVLGKIIS